MIQEGLIETQLISTKGSNILFYTVNNKMNTIRVVEKIYKVIFRIFYIFKDNKKFKVLLKVRNQ